MAGHDLTERLAQIEATYEASKDPANHWDSAHQTLAERLRWKAVEALRAADALMVLVETDDPLREKIVAFKRRLGEEAFNLTPSDRESHG